ncbi:glycosyltransferase family 2 protein, partial [Burkholderia multivorans]|uniref:glycosyltransferase family 2 protein n=1 Tax=Burkholderia multivorans TaxID=87883 RepID=UPI001C2750FC
MTRNPFITFIIPCYDVEDYVAQTLDSILNQTVKKVDGFDLPFEIVCVNDGSNDGTLAVLQQYAAAHNFITVISQENGGLSAARNTGFQHSRGKYTCFLDSDDWIANTFVEEISLNDLNHTGDRGGCLVKVKQVPQSALQVADSIALRPQRAECRRWIR